MSTVTLFKGNSIVHAVGNTASSGMEGNTLCNRPYSLDDYKNGPVPNINPKVTCKACIRQMAKLVADGAPGYRELLAAALDMRDLTRTKFCVENIRPGMYVTWLWRGMKCNGIIEHVDIGNIDLHIKGIDGAMYDSYLKNVVGISTIPPNVKDIRVRGGRKIPLNWDSTALRRIVVTSKDYPGIIPSESIGRRLSREGFKIEDIVNIESNNMESWEANGFVVVWVRLKLFQR